MSVIVNTFRFSRERGNSVLDALWASCMRVERVPANKSIVRLRGDLTKTIFRHAMDALRCSG